MTDCDNIINEFLKSSNEKLNILYQHCSDFVNITGHYKNLKCNMTDKNFEKLNKESSNFSSSTYYDTKYLQDDVEYEVPSKHVLVIK
jgi:hypothetical protein